jgi:hypothetical protein
VPPRLTLDDPIRQDNIKWIVPDLLGQFEGHDVLGKV